MKHRILFLTVILLICTVFMTVAAYAAETFAPGSTAAYFVDNKNGKDTNAGTSASNPVSSLGGDIALIIKGGTFKEAVYGTGMNVHTNRFYMGISGGTFAGAVCPIKRLGTIASDAECTTHDFEANVLVEISGGKRKLRYHSFCNRCIKSINSLVEQLKQKENPTKVGFSFCLFKLLIVSLVKMNVELIKGNLNSNSVKRLFHVFFKSEVYAPIVG